jgi:hypothetical protein
MILDYKFASYMDSDWTELLDAFLPADALHIRYPLEPITIYATKQEINQYQCRLGLISITEIGEEQTMMEMIIESHQSTRNQHTCCMNAYGSGVLVRATHTRQQCSSFEQSYDQHGTAVHEGRCNPNGNVH